MPPLRRSCDQLPGVPTREHGPRAGSCHGNAVAAAAAPPAAAAAGGRCRWVPRTAPALPRDSRAARGRARSGTLQPASLGPPRGLEPASLGGNPQPAGERWAGAPGSPGPGYRGWAGPVAGFRVVTVPLQLPGRRGPACRSSSSRRCGTTSASSPTAARPSRSGSCSQVGPGLVLPEPPQPRTVCRGLVAARVEFVCQPLLHRAENPSAVCSELPGVAVSRAPVTRCHPRPPASLSLGAGLTSLQQEHAKSSSCVRPPPGPALSECVFRWPRH